MTTLRVIGRLIWLLLCAVVFAFFSPLIVIGLRLNKKDEEGY